MKEIIFEKNTPMGNIKGVLRIFEKIIYFKFNQNQYSQQVIKQMEQKGAKIEYSKDKSWIRVDIFGDNEIIKLEDKEINLSESTNDEIEQFIYDFYKNKYEKAGFLVS